MWQQRKKRSKADGVTMRFDNNRPTTDGILNSKINLMGRCDVLRE
jgi:hypothetical protein